MTPATFAWIMKLFSLLCHDVSCRKPKLNKIWLIYSLIIRVITFVGVFSLYFSSSRIIFSKSLGILVITTINNFTFLLEMSIAAVFIVKSYEFAIILIFCKHYKHTHTQVTLYNDTILAKCSSLFSFDAIVLLTLFINIFLLWYYLLRAIPSTFYSPIITILFSALGLLHCCSKLIPIAFCYLTMFLTDAVDCQLHCFVHSIKELTTANEKLRSSYSPMVLALNKFEGFLFKVLYIWHLRRFEIQKCYYFMFFPCYWDLCEIMH